MFKCVKNYYEKMREIIEVEEFRTLVKTITTWIPVEALLPENGMKITNYHNYLYTDSVLVKTNNSCFISKRSRHSTNTDIWKWVGSKKLKNNITHWKPFDYDAINQDWIWVLLKSYFEEQNKTKISIRKIRGMMSV